MSISLQGSQHQQLAIRLSGLSKKNLTPSKSTYMYMDDQGISLFTYDIHVGKNSTKSWALIA